MNTSAKPGLSSKRARRALPVGGDHRRDREALPRRSGSRAPAPASSAACRTARAARTSRRRSPARSTRRASSSGIVPSVVGRDLVDAVSASGARPEALRPASFFVFGSQTMANRSPPRPFAVGSIRPRQAFDGDRGVDRAAALLEDLEPGLHGERLGGAHHAVLRPDWRASGVAPAGACQVHRRNDTGTANRETDTIIARMMVLSDDRPHSSRIME